MHSVLITGGAGFIGQNLVHAWRSARPDDHLVVIDAMTYAANVRTLEPLIAGHSIQFVRGDIRDAALVRRLFDEHKFTRVAHLADQATIRLPRPSCKPMCSALSPCSKRRRTRGAHRA